MGEYAQVFFAVKSCCMHGRQSVELGHRRVGGGRHSYTWRETMGEIDAMRRLEAQSDPLTAFPTLTSDTFLSLQSPQLLELFVQCDPALTATAPAEHHVIFSIVSTLIRDIISSFTV